MQIGEVVATGPASASVMLRHYEALGLISPARTASGYRSFAADDAAHCQAHRRTQRGGTDAGCHSRHSAVARVALLPARRRARPSGPACGQRSPTSTPRCRLSPKAGAFSASGREVCCRSLTVASASLRAEEGRMISLHDISVPVFARYLERPRHARCQGGDACRRPRPAGDGTAPVPPCAGYAALRGAGANCRPLSATGARTIGAASAEPGLSGSRILRRPSGRRAPCDLSP